MQEVMAVQVSCTQKHELMDSCSITSWLHCKATVCLFSCICSNASQRQRQKDNGNMVNPIPTAILLISTME